MAFWTWLILAGGAVLAGVVNAMAGGGSLLTVPLLMLVGLPPNVANGTNRIAVLFQSTVSAWTFHRNGLSPVRLGLMLLPSGLVGAAFGAYLATIVSDDTFRTVFAGIMLPLAAITFLRPARLPSAENGKVPGKHVWALCGLMLPLGIYAGFVQAGVGLLLLAVFSMVGGLDLRHGNAVKVFLVAGFTALSLVIFATRMDLEPLVGLILAVFTGIGGYLGSLAAIRKGETWIRRVVFVSCAALAIRLLLG